MLEIMKKQKQKKTNKIYSFLECFLKSKITTLNKKEFEGFTVTTSNKNSNKIMIDYLKSFHLLT